MRCTKDSPFQIIARVSNQQEGGAYVVLYHRDICAHVVQWVHPVPAQLHPVVLLGIPDVFLRNGWATPPVADSIRLRSSAPCQCESVRSSHASRGHIQAKVADQGDLRQRNAYRNTYENGW
jgi:hypothetical protein